MKKVIKKQIIVTLSLVLGLTFSSCKNNFFDLNRPESLPYQTTNDLDPFVISAYSAHFLTGWYAPTGLIPYYSELAGDLTFVNMWSIEQEAIPWYPRKMSTYDVSGDQCKMTYQALYQALFNCNGPITTIETREAAGQPVFNGMSDLDKAKLQRQKGELYFMRGYTYWMISRIFLPPYNTENNAKRLVPLITKLEPSQEAMRNPAMGSVSEIYDQMVTDFEKAKTLLPETSVERGRVNKYIASAFLMRAYWLMGKTDKALAECNTIINEAVISKKYYDLSEEPIRAFNRNQEATYTVNPVAKEVIWEQVQSATSNAQPIPLCRMSKAGAYNLNSKAGTFLPSDLNWLGGLRATNWSHGGWACAYWSPRIVKQIGWASTDNPKDLVNYVPSAEALKDKRFTQLHYFLKANNGDPNADQTVIEKYYPNITWNVFWNDKYWRAPYARYSNIPLIRLPEIYLTRATLSLASNPTQALADVNLIRQRAGLTPLTQVTESAIENERIKELGFEYSDRLTYLVAMKKTIDGQKPTNENLDKQSRSNDPMSGPLVPAMTYPYSNLYVPVPDVEYLYSGSTVNP
jgi:hypothetical protein